MSVENIDTNFIERLVAAHHQTWVKFDTTHTLQGIEDNAANLIKKSLPQLDDQNQGQAVYQAIEGKLLLHGWGGTKNLIQALDKLNLAADAGFASAQFNLGNCYYYGNGVKEDKKKAFAYYKLAADNNYIPAMFKLADCYYYGEGVASNREEVSNLYDKIADLADADIQFELGCCYEKGHHESGIIVKKDLSKSASFYFKAATQGHANAQYHYALCLLKARGVGEDFDEGIHYLKCAIKQHHTDAMVKLGSICLKGKHIRFNFDDALNYFLQASELNNAQACLHLASFYDNINDDRGLVNPFEKKRRASYYYFKSFILGGFIHSIDRLEEMATDEKLLLPEARAYLIIIYTLGIQRDCSPQKAEKFYSHDTAIALQRILTDSIDDLADYHHTMIHLAYLIIHKSSNLLHWGQLPEKNQEIVFSELVKQSLDHVRTNFDDFENDYQLLKTMSEQGILDTREALLKWADSKAKRLSRLVFAEHGNLINHRVELKKLVKNGSEKARRVLDDYYKKVADQLLEDALKKNRHALNSLVHFAGHESAALTVLGRYYLARGDKQAAKKHLFFNHKKSKDDYYQKALNMFLTATGNDYGLAYYEFGLCYLKGKGIKANPIKAAYLFFKTGSKGYLKEAISGLKEISKQNGLKSTITSWIFQAILLEKKPHFNANKLLNKAYQSDKEHFALRLLSMTTARVLRDETSILLLSWLLSKKPKKDVLAKVKGRLEGLIYKQIDSMIEKYKDMDLYHPAAGFLSWIKYVDSKLVISCVLMIENDRENYSFYARLVLLLAAKRKAENKNLDVKPIDARLSHYLSETGGLVSVLEYVDTELPLRKSDASTVERRAQNKIK